MYGVFRSREYWRESADQDDDMAIVATAGEVLAIRRLSMNTNREITKGSPAAGIGGVTYINGVYYQWFFIPVA